MARFTFPLLGALLLAVSLPARSAQSQGNSLAPGVLGLPGHGVPGSGAAAVRPWSELLPQPGQRGEVMQRSSRVTTVDLQRRVTEVGGDPAALRRVMVKVANGERPAYDTRLNISQSEFVRYLAFQPVLIPTGKSYRLSLSRDRLRLTFGEMEGSLAILRGVSFDLRSGEIQVPEGFTFRPMSVRASAPDRSIDLRGGWQWTMRDINPQTQNGINGQLSLYRLGEGQVLLAYRRTSLVAGRVREPQEVLLTYALP